MKQKYIWIFSFIIPFIIGIVLVLTYCYFKDNYTLDCLSISDWLNYFAASGTIGAFFALIIDKVTNERSQNHLKWQSEIPFVTLTSPCDPTSNYCDINIASFTSEFSERGNQYFTISNIGKTNAYDISILFSSNQDFKESAIFHRHYIPYLAPLVANGYMTQYQDYIYSNFHINPDTKEVSNKKFEICGCLNDCLISTINSNEKYFYVKVEYYSSLSKKHRHKIYSLIRVNLICDKEINEETNVSINSVKIKGITILEYDYK